MLIIPLVTEQEGGFHRFRKKLGIVVHKLRKSHKLTAFRDILGTEMRTRYCLPGSVFSPIVKKGAENFYNGLWSCSSGKAPTGPSLSILETHITAFYKNYPLVPMADR